MRIANAKFGAFLAVGVAVFTAACSNTSTSPSPTPTPTLLPPTHLYVSDQAGSIYVYALPLTLTSTPVVTVTGQACECGMTISQNKLYVGPFVFQLPLTNTSVHIATLTTTSNPIADASDASGTIYIAEDMSATCCVDVYQGGATTPTFTLSGASVNDPFGATIDSGGNLFIANNGSIGYFTTPIHSGQVGITFGRNSFNEGLATDSSINLYVADGNGTGTMDYYHPPYTGATTPGAPVTLGGTLEQMGIASDGTMYVAVESPNQLYVMTTPYTSIGLAVPASYIPYGIAIGP
jgi:hypothetical protein